MSGKGSSAKGKTGQQKHRQKHQNTYAFQSDKYATHMAAITALPVQGLCKRCVEIIQWRKRMGQYKPLTVAKKCVSCSQKTVKEAYHILCNACACNKNVCAKCQQAEEILPSSAAKTPAELQLEKQNEERLLAAMTERQRRSYLRKLERGDDAGAQRIGDRVAQAGSDADDADFDFGFSDEDGGGESADEEDDE
ncbi:hypothetical protein BDR26DRAFT_859177 [Obelidium mucronatum]|nr:hypothetical protein BDR26DRAFT_859177 [Obelidium mucronatum]